MLFLIVMAGLRGRRIMFDRAGLLDRWRAWLARRPAWGGRSEVIGVGAAEALSAGVRARVSVWSRVSPEDSLEARVAALAANVETLKKEQAETARELREELRKQTEDMNSERRVWESAIGELRRKLETLGAGSLHIEMAGVWCFVFGVVLATVPDVIVGIVGALWALVGLI